MKLSVLMITYNHEKFIAQALESALMQEVDFDYDIVVGEDCSTDHTRDILLEYQKKHPDKIRLLLPKHNLGMYRNFVETFHACRGEYIALLEGDDWWTSPQKLQKQVDFLDGNRGYAACFHNVTVRYDDNFEASHPFHRTKLKSTFTLKDIVSDFYIPTCSTVFRKNLYDDFPGWLQEMPMIDWALHVLNAEHGDYHYIDEVLATYRIHRGGIWSMQDRERSLKRTLKAAEIVNRCLQYRFGKYMNPNIAIWQSQLAIYYFKIGRIKNAAYYLCKSVTTSPSTVFASLHKRLKA